MCRCVCKQCACVCTHVCVRGIFFIEVETIYFKKLGAALTMSSISFRKDIYFFENKCVVQRCLLKITCTFVFFSYFTLLPSDPDVGAYAWWHLQFCNSLRHMLGNFQQALCPLLCGFQVEYASKGKSVLPDGLGPHTHL